MEIKNLEAYQQIKEETVKIRDAFIEHVSFKFSEEKLSVVLDLSYKLKNGNIEKIKITCQNIIELDYSVFPDDPVCLEDFKLVYDANQGNYYLSIDPDNSINDIVDEDCNKLFFKDLILEFFPTFL